jgi:hypothetical protein
MTKNIIIAILLVVIILFLISSPSYVKDQVIVKTDTVYQQKTFTKYKKGDSIPFVVLDTIIDQIHDTIKIISDYSRVYSYSDTIRIDSLGYAYIQDTITNNKIIGRSVGLNIQEKTIYITKTIQPKNKTALYLGFLSDMRQDNRQLGIGIGLAIKTANKGVITANATTNGYSLGYYLKF